MRLSTTVLPSEVGIQLVEAADGGTLFLDESGHPFPGNVRELVSRVRRAAVLASGELISPADLELGELRRRCSHWMRPVTMALGCGGEYANAGDAARSPGASLTTASQGLKYGGHQYVFVTTAKPWTNAASACAGMGMGLVPNVHRQVERHGVHHPPAIRLRGHRLREPLHGRCDALPAAGADPRRGHPRAAGGVPHERHLSAPAGTGWAGGDGQR